MEGIVGKTAQKFCDPTINNDALYVSACAELIQEIGKRQNWNQITNLFGLTKTITMRQCLMEFRRKKALREEQNKDAETLTDPNCEIEALLTAKDNWHKLDEVQKALSEGNLNARRSILLALTREDIQEWIKLPEPVPEFACMLEMDEKSVWALWEYLPLKDGVIAIILKTSVFNVHTLRSRLREKLINAILKGSAV